MGTMMSATITLRGGPCDGARIALSTMQWPPPERIYGPDLHRSAYGTYERLVHSQSEPWEAVYSPRVDDDYRRVATGWIDWLNRRLKAETE